MIQNEGLRGGERSGLFRLIASQNDNYCIELGSLVLVSNEVSAPPLNSPPKISGANFTSIKPCCEIVGSAAQRLLHTLHQIAQVSLLDTKAAWWDGSAERAFGLILGEMALATVRWLLASHPEACFPCFQEQRTMPLLKPITVPEQRLAQSSTAIPLFRPLPCVLGTIDT